MVRAFFCSCQPLYRVPSYSSRTLNVVTASIRTKLMHHHNCSGVEAGQSHFRNSIQEEVALRVFWTIVFTLVAAAAFGQNAAVPEIQFDSADVLKLPADMYLGEASGVAVN